MNSKIAMSGLSILASLAVMGGATFAFFSSAATSTANTFAAGSLVLQVDDVDDTTPAATVDASITGAGMAPGSSTTGFISLHNGGSIDIEKIKLAIDTTATDGGSPPDASDIRDVLNMTVVLDDTTPDPVCSGGTNVTLAIDTQVGNGGGNLTLKEFDDGGTDVFNGFLSGAEKLIPTATRNVCFTVTMDPSAGDIYQADSADATFTLTGLQDESQL